MNKQVRLNLYERGIVEALVNDLEYKKTEARKLVVEYIEVIRLLGGYDNCFEHAKRIHIARENGLTPKAWVNRIQKLDRDMMCDKGFPSKRPILD